MDRNGKRRETTNKWSNECATTEIRICCRKAVLFRRGITGGFFNTNGTMRGNHRKHAIPHFRILLPRILDDRKAFPFRVIIFE